MSSIQFSPALDQDPLIQQFDACLVAISNSASGTLDDMDATKQLLASLDGSFYDKVITPIRLDVELAKVDMEDICTHILEIWEQANLNLD